MSPGGKPTNITGLAAIGRRRDGQNVLPSVKNMGGESTSARRQFLDDLDARGLRRPEFVVVDGAPGLEAALTVLWDDDPEIQCCTVRKQRNLLGPAPRQRSNGRKLGDALRGGMSRRCRGAVNSRPENGICRMAEDAITRLPDPSGISPDQLKDVVRGGAGKLIEQAIESERAPLLGRVRRAQARGRSCPAGAPLASA